MISSILARAVLTHGGEIAIRHRGESLRYREVADRISRRATQLRSQARAPGDRVGLLAPNGPMFFELSHAAAHAGLVLVPLNTRLPAETLGRLLRHSGAKVLWAAREFAAIAQTAIAGAAEAASAGPPHSERSTRGTALPASGDPPPADAPAASSSTLADGDQGRILLEVFDEDSWVPERSGWEPFPVHPGAPDDPAQIYYTSGTTGEPKGVVLTHRNVCSHALMAVAALGIDDRDVFAHLAPMFHLADAWATYAVTWVGGQPRFAPRFEPAAVLEVLRGGTTLTNLVPTMLSDLVHHPDAPGEYPALLRLLSGGAPIAPSLVRQLIETFRCPYIQTYGLTETSPFLTMSLLPARFDSLPADEQLARRCKTGRPLVGVELRVVRADGQPVAPDGAEVGEIVCRGDSVTPGYWNNPEATAAAFRDGWFHTGDLATLDPDGFVDIVDRKKDVVLTGGETVYSTEVEHVLAEHPAVQEVAVVGLPHPRWGEAVVAFVVCRAGATVTEDEVRDFAGQKLAAFQRPKRVMFREGLPRTGTGKVEKRRLREEFAGCFDPGI